MKSQVRPRVSRDRSTVRVARDVPGAPGGGWQPLVVPPPPGLSGRVCSTRHVVVKRLSYQSGRGDSVDGRGACWALSAHEAGRDLRIRPEQRLDSHHSVCCNPLASGLATRLWSRVSGYAAARRVHSSTVHLARARPSGLNPAHSVTGGRDLWMGVRPKLALNPDTDQRSYQSRPLRPP